MKKHIAVAVFFIAAGIRTADASADFKLRVGEKRTLPLGIVKGAALDNPSIADVAVLTNGQLSVVGKANGQGRLSIVTAKGKLTSASLSVSGGKKARQPKNADDGSAEFWPKGYFGGKRIPDAYCSEPLTNGVANRSFDQAWDLLRRDRTSEAIGKLEEALRIEPTAAVVHLYLGAAQAKLQDQARGAYHYETFALSCPGDPKVSAVVQVLREFYRTLPKPAAAIRRVLRRPERKPA